MRLVALCVLTAAAVANCATQPSDPAAASMEKGARWLASVQGKDGGWGQDGGETSFIRTAERLESNGNDVANTAAAALALMRAGGGAKGEYRANVERAVQFILKQVEASPDQGLAVTNVTNSQIQRKLGPYIDTFLTSMLFAELDGNLNDKQLNSRLHLALTKCVHKIESNQMQDGSWNLAGGWAPILGTSMASRSLDVAQRKGVAVDQAVQNRVMAYSKANAQAGDIGAGSGGGVGSATARISASPAAMPASAGVPLYQSAQALEQLSRTEKDRKQNAAEIKTIAANLSDERFVRGFGSMGGEEFWSYLNISDSLHRAGGDEWKKWNNQMKTQLVKLQNQDGTWAGHHCITGRVAVTSAAILTMSVENQH